MLNGKQGLLLKPINDFFSKNNNIDRIIPILNGESQISLRIIDWFVTNYSKKNNVNYYNSNKKSQFNVYLSYKNQLKAFSKKQFDPFCRRERIEYAYNKNNYLTTTIGQLNFFKWSLENMIIDFIGENLKDIEKDMNSNIRKNTKKMSPTTTKVKSKRKRRELSSCATKFVNKTKQNIILDFN
tara:strand:- start:812 stop:1360 length:549 start_codon:yes stop_codon:yes gene_type:complete